MRPGRAVALALVGLLTSALGAGSAAADVRVAEHQFQLGALDGWTEVPVAATGAAAGSVSIVAGYRHARTGALLAITRMGIPSPRAWRDDTAFFAEIEAGIASTSAGYQRFHRRQQRVTDVPALDLGFLRDTARGRELVLMRFLFFRRYTLALALTAPAATQRRHERAFRALVDSFAPYLAP
jgi:hypothetical protein